MPPSPCLRCGKQFKHPYLLRRHESRKTPCATILDPSDLTPKDLDDPDLAQKKCRFCGRVFSSYISMRRHVRQSCKIAPNKKNGYVGMEALYEHTIHRQAALLKAQQVQLSDVTSQLIELRQLVVGGIGSTAAGEVAINGEGNVVDNRKQNIIINVFGQEGLDHATTARIRAILDESLTRPALGEAAQTAILRTAMLVYSDPDHPENLTAYLPNKKTQDVLVHADRGGTPCWEVQPSSLVLPPMAKKSVDTIFNRQPYEDADEYGPLMKELSDNEKRYVTGVDLRPILVRNKDLLARALKSIPLAG